MSPGDEGQAICSALQRGMPKRWDGRECLSELRAADYHWRQMEWIGWYNEYKAREVVRAALGGTGGPRYGNTAFDYRRQHVWDFKAHPAGGGPWAVLNNLEAIDSCVRDYGGVGFVLTVGTAAYNDEAGTFKRWHDGLKGETSEYERQRIARGAPSRRRKVAFLVVEYRAVYFAGSAAIKAGLDDGWLRKFQEGMRNADGSPRRPKYMVNINTVPQASAVARVRA
jgi:hypothetical protein